ncbi:MAG: sulfur carrier protein ThiS [Candidatus Thermoplasmatota archaeon]|nr:sulfur carrier protein ThiS [Candidatus Thermoplasmatota archaeon]
MSIIVNGRRIEFKKGESASKLLKRMKYNFPLVIVKIDGRIINREDLTGAELHDNAIVEVIHLTSGG